MQTETFVREREEKKSAIRDYYLEGLTLKAHKVTTINTIYRTPDNTYEKKSKHSIETLSYKLVGIDAEELNRYRTEGVPSFVLKIGDRLFYTKIPKMFNLMSNTFLGKHLCGEICRRLSAASDKLGGCDKVRHHARHIELFSHIESGYETFNTNHDAFVVLKCTHYECCPPRKPLTPKEKARLKLSLASYAETFE